MIAQSSPAFHYLADTALQLHPHTGVNQVVLYFLSAFKRGLAWAFQRTVELLDIAIKEMFTGLYVCVRQLAYLALELLLVKGSHGESVDFLGCAEFNFAIGAV